MARSYRFFARNLMEGSFSTDPMMPFNLSESLEPEIFHQLMKVLRVKAGDSVILLPAGGVTEYSYVVREAAKKEIVLVFQKKHKNENELAFDLGLILCLPNKPDKLEFIVQKAVELGVKKIILVDGDNSQFKHGIRGDRLEKIAMEAAEQSERAMVPTITAEGRLRDYLKVCEDNVWVAMERSEGLPQSAVKGPVSVLIGPEGGFSYEEKELIEDLELPTFSLGRRVLRMETAAIVSLGMIAMRSPR